jgi:cell wall-associated NlpC family hydrolase
MGRSRGRRILGPVLGAGLMFTGVLSGPAAASAARGSSPAAQPAPSAAPTTTTLPALPKVPLTYTAGKSPQTLLSTAISLSSLGLDDTALMAAVSRTQAKLDSDAAVVRKAQNEADQAAQAEAAARRSAAVAEAQYKGMASAVRTAIIELYMSGPAPLTVSPGAGALALYAEDYAASAVTPYGVLAQSRAIESRQSTALQAAQKEAKLRASDSTLAAKALANQRRELARLKAELASAVGASGAAVAADHVALAAQAGKELLNQSSLQFDPKSPLPAPVSTTSVALTWAFAELGKPYVWGATGPNTFDCSGLTQFVWKAAGVSIPRVAADQDAWTIPVPLSQLLPGDLVFFGTTNIHHVGIYIGDGLMINAPHTGTVVQVSSIWWSDLAGFGRVHYPGTPVPPHNTPTPTQPAPPAVVQTRGPVPSQTAPPPGWKPKPGSTTPIRVTPPGSRTPGTTVPAPTTTTSTTSTTSVPADSTTTTVPLSNPGDGTTTTTAPSSGSSADGSPSTLPGG